MTDIDEVYKRAQQARTVIAKQNEKASELNTQLDQFLERAQATGSKIKEIEEILRELSTTSDATEAIIPEATSKIKQATPLATSQFEDDSSSQNEHTEPVLSKAQKRRVRDLEESKDESTVESTPSSDDLPLPATEADEELDDGDLEVTEVPFGDDDDTLDEFDNIDFG